MLRHTTLFSSCRSQVSRATWAVVFFQTVGFNGDNVRNTNVTVCKVGLIRMGATTPISGQPVSLMTISMIIQSFLESKKALKGLQQQQADG